MSGSQPQSARHVLDWLAERGARLHPGSLAPPRPAGLQPGHDGGVLEDGRHPRTEGLVSSHSQIV